MLNKIETQTAPQAIGPYSQATVISASQKLIFVSGQLPIDPATNQLVQGEMRALTNRVLDNIEAILVAGNSSLKHVLRVDIFLVNLADFAIVNEVYATRFSSQTAPARQTIQVAALPKGASIEISCIAYVP